MSPSRTARFTPLQGQYLSFIHTYEGVHGCAPAEADCQRHFGVTPPSVHRMVVTLERKGLITRVAGAARSIRLRIAPTELPPLERRGQPASDHARAPREAIRPRTMDHQTTRKPSPPARTREAHPDPAAEYVDSLMMTQRLRFAQSLSVRIAGRYGDYRTRMRLTRKLDGDCTCPSDPWPCKHVRALRATWRTNPHSFFDVQAFLKRLDSVEKRELIETIGKIVLAFPQALGLLGVAKSGETAGDDNEDLHTDESED